MFTVFFIAIMASMVGLVLYELVDEVRGSERELHDHYHE
jgi:hypothetical protein